MKKKLIPVFIIEEHHEAFIVWNYAIQQGLIPPTDNVLLHVDEHSDMCAPQFNISIQTLNGDIELIKKFTYTELGIASFIIPAIYKKIFSKMHWIKQDHYKADIIHNEMFVRSYNNAGKKLFLGKMTEELKAKSTNVQNDIITFDYYLDRINQLDNINNDIIILDIDLDYFSCSGNPNVQKEIQVEITKEEYNRFIFNKYHQLHFVGLNKIRTEFKGGRYYYVLNDFDEVYPSELHVDEKTIIHRIEIFCKSLADKNIQPALISFCRSFHSGYTPKEQCELIQNTLFDSMSKIFHLNKIKSL